MVDKVKKRPGKQVDRYLEKRKGRKRLSGGKVGNERR